MVSGNLNGQCAPFSEILLTAVNRGISEVFGFMTTQLRDAFNSHGHTPVAIHRFTESMNTVFFRTGTEFSEGSMAGG